MHRDAQVKQVFNELDADKDEFMTFEEFIAFMKKRHQDSDTKDEILSAFREVTGGKPTITPDQLASILPPDQAASLAQKMPKASDGTLDFSKWTDYAFQT